MSHCSEHLHSQLGPWPLFNQCIHIHIHIQYYHRATNGLLNRTGYEAGGGWGGGGRLSYPTNSEILLHETGPRMQHV